MTRILLIRHGSTDAVGHVLSGRTPGVHLNEEGRRQAQELAKQLKRRYNLAAVVCSPLERAIETAQYLAEAQQVALAIDDRFNELDFGQWTGCTFSQLSEQPAWTEYNRYRSIHRAPGGEMLVDVQGRAWRGICSLCTQFPEAAVAVVSHADVIRSVLMLTLGMPLDNLLRLDIPPGSVSEITAGEGEPVLHRLDVF